MNTENLIAAIICFTLVIATAIISLCQFNEKGFLFNNAYIYSSKTERETMDKKPHYRQSAIAFCLLSVVFFVIGISIIFSNSKIQLLEIPLIIITLIYVIVSSIRIEKQKKK